MKILRKTEDLLELEVPTDSDRDLGYFLIFVGLVCVYPLYYIIEKFVYIPWKQWVPYYYIAAIFVAAGLYLLYYSKKKIRATREYLTIKDGFFHAPITFRWKYSPAILLKSLEVIRRSVPTEDWMVFLVDGKHEYLIDRKVYHQIEMRVLAEQLAKFLKSTLIDVSGDLGRIEIDSHDLDLPFRERVRKYPQLKGPYIEKPAVLRMKERILPNGREYSWGIATAGFLLEILMFAGGILLLTFLPIFPGGYSLYTLSKLKDNYFFYYWFMAIVPLILLFIGGYKIHLKVTDEFVSFRESLWGIPFIIKKILNDNVEEIRYHTGLRGPVFQIISDDTIISFRLPDKERARWLTSYIRYFLATREEGLCPKELSS